MKMINEEKIEKLIKMGAKRWTAYGKDRLYLNKAGKKLVNLTYDYNEKGKIEQAYVDGEEISNRFASKINHCTYAAYINLENEEIYMPGDDYNDINDIKEIMIEKIRNL